MDVDAVRALGAIPLPPDQPARPYAGGPRIARFRRGGSPGPHRPEDFVGSTVEVGADGAGLARLPDGTTLRDAIERDPAWFLGEAHVTRLGADPALLVKLLNPEERLFVHLHPTDGFAAAHLGSPRGKTEAWIVLEAPDGGGVAHLGFREDVDPGRLAAVVEAQDATALLELLHPVPLQAGDAVLVPGGTAHAIGPGLLLAELQQPTDFSILLEWAGYDLVDPASAFLGLPRADALGAVDTAALPVERLAGLVVRREAEPGRTGLLPAAADPFFRAERVVAVPERPVALDAGFAIGIAVAGSGRLGWDGGATAIAAGDAVLLAAGLGPVEVEGRLELLRCRPPAVG